MAGTTVSFRYWPVAPVPPPRTSILVALEPITSTFPLLITPPMLVVTCLLGSPGMLGKVAQAHGVGTRLGNAVVVLHRTAADANRSDEDAFPVHNRESTWKRDQSFVRVFDA